MVVVPFRGADLDHAQQAVLAAVVARVVAEPGDHVDERRAVGAVVDLDVEPVGVGQVGVAGIADQVADSVYELREGQFGVGGGCGRPE